MSKWLDYKYKKTFMWLLLCLLYLSLFCLKSFADDTGPAKDENMVLGKATTGSESGTGSDTPLPDLFTGAMSYRIPLEVPLGKSGMQPDLALAYRSSNGNGWIGLGWELLDIGAIERSIRGGVVYSDGNYVLRKGGSAAELVNIGGSDYRGKIENEFLKIEQGDGGTGSGHYWIAISKNGTKYYYGGTSNSEQSDSIGTFKWCLRGIEDTNGNYVTFTYTHDQGQVYLDQIDYNNNSIKFYLEARSDAPENYATNFKVVTAHRLKTIDVIANGHRVRAYKLTYTQSQFTNQSLLLNSQEFGKDAVLDDSGTVTSGSALPPVTLSYSPELVGFDKKTVTVDNYSSVGGLTFGDFNGDGCFDWLFLLKNGGNQLWVSLLSSGFDSWGQMGWGTFYDYYRVADFSADSKSDILFINTNGALSLAISNGSNFNITNTAGQLGDRTLSRYKLADVTGDSKADLFFILPDGTQNVATSTGTIFNTQKTWLKYGNGDPLRYIYADFSGDGMADMLYIGADGKLFLATSTEAGSGSPVERGSLGDGVDPLRYKYADCNGDGKLDLLYVKSNGQIFIALSTGSGFTISDQPWIQYGDGNPNKYMSFDFNADGKSDIIYTDVITKQYIGLSTGYSFTTLTLWGELGYRSAGSPADNPFYNKFFDINGDGVIDIISFLWTPLAAPNSNFDILMSKENKQNLLSGIYNGNGGNISIKYWPWTLLHQSNPNLPFPVYSVSTIATCDNYDLASNTCNGNLAEKSYAYDGGFYHVGEHDFRGFNHVTVTGPVGANGEQTITETWFHQGNDLYVVSDTATQEGLKSLANVQTGYMKGKPYRTRVNGIVGNQQKKYSEITTEYIAKTLTPYVFTPPLQINSYIYDGETGYKRSRTVYAFDPTNGNLTHEYQYGDYSDATDDRTIVKTYFPETSKWLVGLPTSETIYKGIGESTQEAKIDYYYDEATNDWCPESTNPTTAKGNLTSTVSWLKDLPSPTVKRAYDNYGNLRCIKDANGNISKISYDSSFTFPKISTNPMGQQTIIQYYGVDYMPTDTGLYGQVKSVTDPNGVTIDKEYDNFGRITKITDPYSRPGAYPYNTQSATYGTVSYQYNNFGTVGQQNITKIMTEKVDSITGLSCPASWWYNSTTNNCQKTQCYSSGWGGTTCYQLFSPPVCTGGYLDGNIDACRTPINIWDEEYFDGFGRTYKTRKKGPDGKVIVADTKYDGRGAVSQLSLPYFEGTALSDQLNQTFVYDPLGRITQVTNTDNTVAKSCYNKDITVLIDENNHRKRQTRDAFGHLIKVEEYKGVYPTCTTDVGTLYATTTYQYDVLGNLRFVTDAMGNQTEMRYDTLGRKTFMHDPDMGDWFYTYYNNGDLKTQTDANLKTTTFVYDALNRLKTKDYPTGTDVIYTYDEATSSNPIGRLTTMSDESGTTKYNYDKLGRTQKIEKTVDGWAYPLEFTYDLIGRVTSLKYPDGEIMSYGYDTGGNLNQAIGYFTYSGFNALGQPDTLTFGNGTITKYAYSPTNFRLSSIKTTTPKQTPLLIDLAYLYYDNGNIKTITNNLASTKTQTFTYDELDRIKSAQSTAYGTKSFDYDQIGNFTNKEGVTFTPKSGLAHRINCISTGRCYSYDFNGNTINDGVRSISYTYDNMPRTINSSINFTYDGNGTRTKKVRTTSPVTTTVYIDKLFECVNGACAKYIFAGDDRIALKSATKILSYHQDHLGSTASVTDAFGYKVDDISYNPFGTLQAETGSEPVNHKFTGQELDSETGLYNYNARLYDQVVGRFVTADTIIPDPANPQSLNRYSYVLNNPINLVDPTGNSSIDFELNYSGGYNDPWANYTLPSRDSIGPPPSQMGASPSSANMNSNGWYSGAINYLEGRAVSNLDSGNNVAAFIDTLGITAIDTLLPQSAYEVPLLFMGGVGKAGYNAAKRMGTLSNIEARLYYNSKLPVLSKAIERWKGQGLALQTVSEKASSLRNTLKLRTRNLMVDQATAQSLPPIRSYQYYLDKYTAEGLSGDALYNRIIKGTLTPNPGVNANFGIW